MNYNKKIKIDSCKLGQYALNAFDTCKPCPLGTYSNKKGETSCHPCDVGYYSVNYHHQFLIIDRHEIIEFSKNKRMRKVHRIANLVQLEHIQI